MQMQWTRGAQPHSFQKRARATLARLELCCLSMPERGIKPTTKIEVLSNRPGGELEKRPIIQHHFPLAPVALCIGHVEPQPSNAAEMEAPLWRFRIRLSENECIGMRNYQIQNGSALPQRHRPSQETLCK